MDEQFTKSINNEDTSNEIEEVTEELAVENSDQIIDETLDEELTKENVDESVEENNIDENQEEITEEISETEENNYSNGANTEEVTDESIIEDNDESSNEETGAYLDENSNEDTSNEITEVTDESIIDETDESSNEETGAYLDENSHEDTSNEIEEVTEEVTDENSDQITDEILEEEQTEETVFESVEGNNIDANFDTNENQEEITEEISGTDATNNSYSENTEEVETLEEIQTDETVKPLDEEPITDSNVSFDNIPTNHINAKDKKIEIKKGPFISKKMLILLTLLFNIILLGLGALFIYLYKKLILDDYLYIAIILFALDAILDILIIITSAIVFKKQHLAKYTNEFETLESVKPSIDENNENNSITSNGNTLKFDSIDLVLNNKELDYGELVKSLYQYFLDNKLLIEKDDVIKIISSMFTAKICLLKTNDNEGTKKFVGVLSSFFGALPFGVELDNYQDYFEMLSTNYDFYDFNTYSLNNNNLNICYAEYENTNLLDFFKKYIPYFNYCDEKLLVKNVRVDFNVVDIETEVSKKIWYFINIDDKDISSYANLLCEGACLLNINIQDNNIEDITNLSIDNINYKYYQVLKQNDADKPFLTEEQWVKLDTIINCINENHAFTLDDKNKLGEIIEVTKDAEDANEKFIFSLTNKIIIGIEEYAKVILKIDKNLKDLAFDTAIASVLIPIIRNLDLSDQTIQDLIKMMEDTFGCDAISLSISQLKAL